MNVIIAFAIVYLIIFGIADLVARLFSKRLFSLKSLLGYSALAGFLTTVAAAVVIL